MSFVTVKDSEQKLSAVSGADISNRPRAARVWLLTNAPSPYQSELFSAISQRDDVELEVRFMLAGSPAGRAASRHYRSIVMRSLFPRFLREELHFHPRAVWESAFASHDLFVLSGL